MILTPPIPHHIAHFHTQQHVTQFIPSFLLSSYPPHNRFSCPYVSISISLKYIFNDIGMIGKLSPKNGRVLSDIDAVLKTRKLMAT